jgi:hypothetical protein
VTRRPWGAKEFAILDKQVGIRFQQWLTKFDVVRR